MTKLHPIQYCVNCADELSLDELSETSPLLCAFCQHVRYEALEIQAQKDTKKRHKQAQAQPVFSSHQ